MWHNDPVIARQPWREERYKESKKFTIGYYTDDNYMPASPACIRAVEEAADGLRQLGHTLVPYKPFDVYEAVRLYVAIAGADGLLHGLDGLENEPPHPMYRQTLLAAALPRPVRAIITRLISLIGEKRNSLILKNVGQKSANEYFDLIINLKKYTDRWMDDMRKNKIDLLLVSID
jgi:Asp-tRNA(Asn)/Glu-tRNA(Gln) amidotransferase A subunit family amidase